MSKGKNGQPYAWHEALEFVPWLYASKLCFIFLYRTYFDTTWDMIWFPKGLLTVNGSWHFILQSTGTQSEGFWHWFIEINKMWLMFWHCPSCGGIKIATFLWLNVSLSSTGEERCELYPLGPTGRSYHWCTLRLLTGTALWDTQQSTLRRRQIHSPVQCIFNNLNNEQCSKQPSLNLIGFEVHLVHTMFHE